jgi:hypothetical protein
MALIAWLRVNKRLGWSEMIHASAVSCRVLAVPGGRDHPPIVLGSHEVVFDSSAHGDLTFGSEVRKASDKPSDNGPS